MNNITIFNNDTFGSLRTTKINNELYFAGIDVARALGYSGTCVSKAINQHCKNRIKIMIEQKTKVKSKTKNKQQVSFIPQSNVLLLIQKAKTSSIDHKTNFKNWLISEGLLSDKTIMETRKEIEFKQTLVEGLKPFNLTVLSQVVDNVYRLDFFIPELNIVIEYDENYHQSYDKDKERERELYIKNKYAKLIRVSDRNTDSYNLGLIIKQIYSI